jgi:hypothetical protein
VAPRPDNNDGNRGRGNATAAAPRAERPAAAPAQRPQAEAARPAAPGRPDGETRGKGKDKKDRE